MYYANRKPFFIFLKILFTKYLGHPLEKNFYAWTQVSAQVRSSQWPVLKKKERKKNNNHLSL